jgi:hypothetical protein
MAEHQTAIKDVERGFDHWVVRPLQGAQGAIAKGAEWWWQATRPFIPGVGNAPFSELVDKSFNWAGQVLDLQRDFTKTILGMLPEATDTAEPKARAKASAS